jgi:glycyl-tRNA synthetase
MTASGQNLSYFDTVNNTRFLPYVIEPAMGLGRITLAALCDAYTVECEGENMRTYLKLNPKVSPIKVGVLPVVKKLSEEGKQVYAQLSEEFICEYDETGSVGKRYARMDEIGTPFCVTIDSENFDAGNVTVRHRDSTIQETVALTELNSYIREKLI